MPYYNVLQLYLNLNAGGKIQGHEGLDGLLAGVENIDQTLVGSALELLTGVLVLVDRAKDGDDLLLGGQGDGAGDGGAVALGGLDDLLGAGVDELMIIGLEANSDHFLVCHLLFPPKISYSVFSFVSLGTVEKFLTALPCVSFPAHENWPTQCRPSCLTRRYTPRSVPSQPPDDLSQVMFIATANDTNTIPRPLLDRMELIELSGYITEEKIEIGKRHLVPKKIIENGLDDIKNLKLPKKSLEFLIENYTRESGVRGLEKQIDKLFRKIALKVAKGEVDENISISENYIEELLGKPLFNRDIYQGNEFAGVVTGLAWTSVGGEILFIETSLSKGKGTKLTLTGNLGDVMKESAMLALEYIKAHAEDLNIDIRIFDNYNIHIHVPEGAVPKDGPSAGITIATSIASILTQRKVRKNLAMTGEITLRGKVLPVGGIKEKILAAKRAGITDIVICNDNRKDIDEIPQMYLTGLTFHYVETIADVLQFALLDEKVKNAVEFKIDEEKKNVEA